MPPLIFLNRFGMDSSSKGREPHRSAYRITPHDHTRGAFVFRHRCNRIPDFDQATRAGTASQVHGPILVFEGEAFGIFGMGENRVYGIQDRLRRPERHVQHRVNPRVIRQAPNVLFEPGSHVFKNLWGGALQAIDRLLQIPDNKRRTRGGAVLVRAVVKGIGQPTDNGPLVWVRVLRFIHQHVAQALIQLERHPCPSAVFGGPPGAPGGGPPEPAATAARALRRPREAGWTTGWCQAWQEEGQRRNLFIYGNMPTRTLCTAYY